MKPLAGKERATRWNAQRQFHFYINPYTGFLSLSLSLYIRDQRSATALISTRVKALTWNYTGPLGHGDYLSFYYTPRRINFDFGGKEIIDRNVTFRQRDQRFEETINEKKNRLSSLRYINFRIILCVKIFLDGRACIWSIPSYLINIDWPHGKHRESHDHASQPILFHRAPVAFNEHKSKQIFPRSEPVRSSPK